MNVLLWIIATGLGFAALALLLDMLAKNNIFVTYVRNNGVKYVKRGGMITRAIWVRQGKQLVFNNKDKKQEWIDGLDPNKMYTSEFIGPIDTILWFTLKMRVVGIPPFFSIDRWKYTWNSYKPGHKDADANGIVHHVEEEIDENFIVAYYAFEFDNVEIGGNFKIKQWTSLTIEIEDPIKAHTNLQPKGDWLRKFWMSTQTRILEFCSTKNQDAIRAGKYSGKGTEFSDFFLKENDTTNINDELSDITGVKVIDLDWIGFESEELSTQADALKKKETQRLEQEAVLEAEKINIEIQKQKTLAFIAGEYAQDQKKAELLENNPALAEIKKIEAIADSNLISLNGDLGLILNSDDVKRKKNQKK